MNQRNQNLISIGVVLIALVIGSSKWLPIGGSIQQEVPASASTSTSKAG